MAIKNQNKLSSKVVVLKTPPKKINYFTILILTVLLIETIFLTYLAYRIMVVIPGELDDAKYQLSRRIDLSNTELRSKIEQLSEGLIRTETDLGKQLSALKAEASADFSGIIETSINSVINVRTNSGQGTGFIIAPEGYVVTNAHVLSGARYARAITSDQDIKEMDLIGYNLTLDIALLKIQGEYPYLEFRDSEDIRVGEKVIAIGNPLGLSFSVSEGIISGIDREGMNELPAYIQTDAALNPGNSGGPLIGTDGKVIGINNFKAVGENLGFALESNYIKKAVNGIALENLNKTILR